MCVRVSGAGADLPAEAAQSPAGAAAGHRAPAGGGPAHPRQGPERLHRRGGARDREPVREHALGGNAGESTGFSSVPFVRITSGGAVFLSVEQWTLVIVQ